ncbi:MAG: inositol phosphatase [Sulfuricurvum sp. PC08-66]|nr:MAG: inositol phosphatase [Sulfuricurvum sp. PC08-66]
MNITQLVAIVKSAKNLFLEGYTSQKNVAYKGTVDLVTQYDVAIEAYLTQALNEAFPHYTVVGEESTQTMHHPAKAIYIDPIDGTTNFVHGLPFCAISVGVWEDGAPLMGVVYNPVLDECFTAVRGGGAMLNGAPIAVSTQTLFQQSLLATGFPYTKTQKGEDYAWVLRTMAAMLPDTRDIRRYGSAAIDLCYVACGKFEGYYECNLKPWDVAAGMLILLESGGRVTNEKGEFFDLDDHILVASNTHIHDALLARVI